MANYSFAVWIALSAGLLLLFFYAALINLRRRRLPEIDLDEVVPYLLPVNLEALSDALSSSQDVYLRHSSPRQEYQKQQKKRSRLAVEYLRRMSHNAALLQRVGYGQINSGNPLLAAQAQELIDAGVYVRVYAFLGLAAIFCRRVSGFAPARISEVQKMMSTSLIPAYESLRSKAHELTTLRDTSFRDALARSL